MTGQSDDHSDDHRPDPDDVPNGPELDDELRKLFADDRLSLPVSRDAGAAVVAGAQRRRRKRMALATTGGVLAMAAVVFAGAMLSGLVHPVHRVNSAGPVLSTTAVTPTKAIGPPVPTPTPATTSSPEVEQVLGPYGLGDLELGMSWQKAVASGELHESAPVLSAGCLRYTVALEPIPTTTPSIAPPVPVTRSAGAAGAPSKVAEVVVSVRDGLVQVIAGPMLRTPEGVGVGSTKDDLSEAYPKAALPPRGGSTNVEVVKNPMAVYVFDVSGAGTVTSFSLRMAKTDCLG
ncbi:MAG TPA: hypothetical protein VH333_09545 [Pseudonocardiaceae bacterium]|nr:hypothetical protein [Pseudonocardiaceae bacterium]